MLCFCQLQPLVFQQNAYPFDKMFHILSQVPRTACSMAILIQTAESVVQVVKKHKSDSSPPSSCQECRPQTSLKTSITNNVDKTIINHPFGNGLYHLFMVIWGMVYDCFTHIIIYIYDIYYRREIWHFLNVFLIYSTLVRQFFRHGGLRPWFPFRISGTAQEIQQSFLSHRRMG